MKYPANQFEILVKCIKILSSYIDVNSINKNSLHYMINQQYNEYQKHNHLIIVDGELKRKFSLVDGKMIENNGELLVFPDFNFELYPEGCNDTHVETAMKNALKQVN